MRNVWLRIGIIVVATFLTVLLFRNFQHNKMDENLQKFLSIDKSEKAVKESLAKKTANPSDTVALQNYNAAKTKLDKAKPDYDSIIGLIKNFRILGAKKIAKEANENGWLKAVESGRLKDDVRNANDFLVLESKANTDVKSKAAYDVAKVETEKYKEPLKKFLNKEISLDSTMLLLNGIYPIAEVNKDNVREKIEKFNIEKALAKDIDKADNSKIVWGIMITSLIFCLIYLYVEKIRTPTAYKVAVMFKRLQLFSSAAFSIGHGGNDAQKVMGIIGAALIANGTIQNFADLPSWVPVACYLAIGLGTMSGGWKIIKTMGTKITKVTPLEGVAAETSGAFTLFFTEQMGIPVSTTHTITGCIIGVGATKRLSAVRWGVTLNLLWAWILTIPVSGILAAIVYFIVSFFIK
jgi:phosphate/sulfate permease